jgi:hypothetical protein
MLGVEKHAREVRDIGIVNAKYLRSWPHFKSPYCGVASLALREAPGLISATHA